MKQPDTEEISMNVDKEHLVTFRTAAAAFNKLVQDICQEGVQLFVDNKLKITDRSRHRYHDSAIYTVRLNREVAMRFKEESEKRDVPVSVVFRAWALELDRRHKFEIDYQEIDFKKVLPKNLSKELDVHVVEAVRGGEHFVARINIPIRPPFEKGEVYVKGRKVLRVGLDKHGKHWVIYSANA